VSTRKVPSELGRWECLSFQDPVREDNDPNIVSCAELVPMMALARQAGLRKVVAAQVRPGAPCGMNTELGVACLVAGMAHAQAASMTWTCYGTAR
jgi:hypothetical protein